MKTTSTLTYSYFCNRLARALVAGLLLMGGQAYASINPVLFSASLQESPGKFKLRAGPAYNTTPAIESGEGRTDGLNAVRIVSNQLMTDNGLIQGYDGLIVSKDKVALVPGKAYEVSVYAKAANGLGKVTAFRTPTGTTWENVIRQGTTIPLLTGSPAVGTAYKKYSFRFTYSGPANADEHIAFRMERFETEKPGAKPADYGQMYLDDVQVKELCKAVFTVGGGGCYRGSGPGLSITLSDSEADVDYSLYRDGVKIAGATISTGVDGREVDGPFPIFFKKQTIPGTYTVKATALAVGNGSVPCDTWMKGSAKVTLTQKVTLILTASPFPVCTGIPTTYTARAYLGGTVTDNGEFIPPTISDATEVTDKFRYLWERNGEGYETGQNGNTVSNADLGPTDYMRVFAEPIDGNDPAIACLAPPPTPGGKYPSNKIYLSSTTYFSVNLSQTSQTSSCASANEPVVFRVKVTQFSGAQGLPGNSGTSIYTWILMRGQEAVLTKTTLNLEKTFEVAAGLIQDGDRMVVEFQSDYGNCANVSNEILLSRVSTTYWTGAFDNNWFDSRNWTGCVPDAATDAYIPDVTTDGTFQAGVSAKVIPYVKAGSNQGAKVRNLTVESAVLVKSAADMELKGNLNLIGLGSFDADKNSLTVFSGPAGQQIGGGTFHNLVLIGQEAKELVGEATVKGELRLAAGKLALLAHNLTIQSSGSVQGASADHYVITGGTGKLWFEAVGPAGREAFFPVGTADSYTPARIRNDGLLNSYGVRVVAGVRANGSLEPGLSENQQVVKKTWDLEAGSEGTSDVTLTLHWNAEDEADGAGDETKKFDRAQSFVAHFENGAWNRNPGEVGPATSHPDGSFSKSRSGLRSFSPFSVGSGDNSPLPVTLRFFRADKQGADALLTWETATEQGNKGFGVEVSSDGETFRSLGFVRSKGAHSQSKLSYSFLDRESGKSGTRYYRLRQTDLDGTLTYSAIQALTFEAGAGLTVLAFPNPFREAVALEIASDKAQPALLQLRDALGREVLSRQLSLQAGLNRQQLELGQAYSTGIYYLSLYVNGQVYHTKLLKQ